MNKGFITTSVLISIVLGIALIGGGMYAVYKVNEVQKVNQQKIQELEEKLSTAPAVVADEAVAVEVSTTTAETNDIEEEPAAPTPAPEVRTVIEREVVYITEPARTTEEANVNQNSEQEEPLVEITEEQVEEVSPISVVSVGQTAYPDGYGGVYGAYGLTLRVVPNAEDILIPMTTNDSLGTAEIGFTYSVTGQEFRGTQDSEVSLCTNFDGNLCKFKVGQDKNIKVTVWIWPDENSSGNYGVNFDTLTYFEGGIRKQFVVDRVTAKINLIY